MDNSPTPRTPGPRKWAIFAIGFLAMSTAVFTFMTRIRSPGVYDNYNPKPKRLSDASRQILDTSEQFVLLSLEPLYPNQPSTETPEKFHDYPVLGKLEIKDPKQKGDLLRTLYKGIADSD